MNCFLIRNPQCFCHVISVTYLRQCKVMFRSTVVEEDRTCSVTVSSIPLHITSATSASQLGCGTNTQPWIFEAPAGQRIEVSLLDFTKGRTVEGQDLTSTHTNCIQYGYILEKSAKKNVSICGGDGSKRQRTVYTSTTNVLEIVLSRRTNRTEHDQVNVNYLLKLQGL